MEIKLGMFLHIVPIVIFGKFCESPLGLLWVEKGPVNKLFRFDPEGWANRCWLGPYFEGVYCIFMSWPFEPLPMQGGCTSTLCLQYLEYKKLPIWVWKWIGVYYLESFLSVFLLKPFLLPASALGWPTNPPVYLEITVFQGRVTRVCSGEKWRSKLRDSHRLARWSFDCNKTPH